MRTSKLEDNLPSDMNLEQFLAFVNRIKQESREYQQDENLLHNEMEHHRLLTVWARKIPEAVERWEVAGILRDMAIVIQQRMSVEVDRLEAMGEPYETAIREAWSQHSMVDLEDLEELEDQQENQTP